MGVGGEEVPLHLVHESGRGVVEVVDQVVHDVHQTR